MMEMEGGSGARRAAARAGTVAVVAKSVHGAGVTAQRERTMSTKRPVVLDKSYVQGVRSLWGLGAQCELLFADALLFELVATDETARCRCLRKLEEVGREGGIRLVPNVGELRRKEVDGLRPAGRPANNVMDELDVSELFGMDFDNLDEDRLEALRDRRSDFAGDVQSLISSANTMLDLFPGTSSGSTESRAAAFRDAEKVIADDRAFVPNFFGRFVCVGPHAPRNAASLAELARVGGLDPEWTIFR